MGSFFKLTRMLVLFALATGLAACDMTTAGPGDTLAVRYVADGSPATITFTTTDGPSQASSTGHWEHAFEANARTELSLEALSSTGAPLTASIFIDGALFRSQRGLNVRLDASTSEYESGEVEVHGYVEAVGADRVTGLGLTFVVDDQTDLLGRSNEAIPLDSFKLGTYVEAEGHIRSDGVVTAKKIKLEDGEDEEDGEHGEEDDLEVEGTIQALTASSLTVQNIVFEVDVNTELLDRDNHAVAFSAFHLGDSVEVEGSSRPDGTAHALKVKLEDND